MGRSTRSFVLGRRSKAERVRERQGIVLRDRLVTRKTLGQYYKFTRKLLPWIRNLTSDDDLDETVCSWVEHYWETGRLLYQVSCALCGLQFFMPGAKGRISQSWKLFRLWRKLEIPCRAPPITAELTFSFAALAIHRGDLMFAGLLLLGFEGLLRTGELLHLRGTDVLIRDDVGLVRLDETKTSFNKGAEEFVPLQHPWVLMVVSTLLSCLAEQRVLSEPIWKGTPAAFRRRFRQYCSLFHVRGLGFRPYSLRRGGATDLFQRSFS